MEPVQFPRRALPLALDGVASFRALVIQGARQVGKSTLATNLADRLGASLVTLDREEDRAQALDDPMSFLDRLGTPAVIDEVQRAGDPLVLALKRRLDGSATRGQYVLTASTNFLTTPVLSESLAGRIDLLTLWPLSIGELTGGGDGLAERALTGPEALLAHRGIALARADYLELVCRGGYPEAQSLDGAARRRWFERYLETVLRREVATATDLRRFEGLQRLARLLMARTSSELVISRLGADVGIDRATAESYEPWLETAFLVHRSPAWSRNIATRTVRRPKIYACDTGLAAAIQGKDATALARPQDPSAGSLVESFVVAELAKQLTWSASTVRLHHYREPEGAEVDAVLEASDGRVVGIEVKSGAVPRVDDVKHLARLRDRLDAVGSDFVVGVLLHTGDRRLRLGDRLVALPIADLWT